MRRLKIMLVALMVVAMFGLITPLVAARASAAASSCGAWTVVSSPSPGSYNVLDGVAANAKNDVWAVGYSDNQTLTEHWNGTAWSVVASANASSQDLLDAAAAISTNDVWAVGYSGSTTDQTLTEQWNGTSWNVVASPSPAVSAMFTGVAAIPGGSNAWAVGHYTDSSNIDHTLIEQWNGTAWSVIPSPNQGAFGSDLLGVTAVSAKNAWAVGTYSNKNGNFGTLAEQWNGTSWTIIPSAAIADNGVLWSVTKVPESNTIWVAGTTFDGKSGLNLALSAYWDGSKWHKVSNPNVAGSNNIFFGVAAVSAKNVLAVGLTFTNTGPDQTFSEQWSGTAWHILSTPDPSGSGTLTAVTRVPGASLYWAVGVSEGGGHNTLIESYC